MKKDCWDKAKIIAEIIAVIIIAFYGYWINATLKQKELNVQMIEVAIDILAIKPSQETDPLRDWAIKILNKYSEVPLSEEAKKALKKRSIKEPNKLLLEDGSRILLESGDALLSE